MDSDLSGLRATETDEGVRLPLRAQPGASRPAFKGVHNGALKVAVNAPADRGRANHALVEYLGELLGVPRSSITLLRGRRARDKLFLVEGLRLRELLAKLTEKL